MPSNYQGRPQSSGMSAAGAPPSAFNAAGGSQMNQFGGMVGGNNSNGMVRDARMPSYTPMGSGMQRGGPQGYMNDPAMMGGGGMYGRQGAWGGMQQPQQSFGSPWGMPQQQSPWGSPFGMGQQSPWGMPQQQPMFGSLGGFGGGGLGMMGGGLGSMPGMQPYQGPQMSFGQSMRQAEQQGFSDYGPGVDMSPQAQAARQQQANMQAFGTPTYGGQLAPGAQSFLNMFGHGNAMPQNGGSGVLY